MASNRGNRGKVVYLISELVAFREKYRIEGRRIEMDVDEMIAAAEA